MTSCMSNETHVCILTTAHPIDDVRVKYKFAHAFCEEGYRVSWVGPGHVFFDRENRHKNIQFRLAPPNRGRLDRLLAPFRIRKLAATVKDVDVYYAPDPDSASVALYLAKQNGAKVIFDIHEVFHGALLDRWLLGRRLPFIRNYVRQRITRICSRCDLVLGVSDAVLAPYLRHDIKYMLIRSCAPSWFANGKPAEVCEIERRDFRIMHGKSDLSHGTIHVVEAVALSRARLHDLHIVMFKPTSGIDDNDCGDLFARIQKLKLSEFIDMRPAVPMQEMPAILQTCDAGLVAYGRGLGTDSLPNRLFEYMAAGLAIIAPVYAREIARIIDSEKCGILVDFEDPSDIARAVLYLRENPNLCREMGRRAREAFQKRHNWETEVLPVIDRIKKWKMQI
jgi:glycosyltransferase involved in cell wall biosynthesis